jgi:methionyl-tRNA formyltransferase
MRIGYFADGPWAHEALERIVANHDFSLAFIVPRYETQDPFLKKRAEELDLPYIAFKNVNTKAFLSEVDQYDADIFVSMSFNQILKGEIINFAPKGFINCHAGALPYYRGRSPLNWVLINGEKTFGITVHFVDEGIDTGDIIEQRHYAIKLSDDYGTLLELARTECSEVLICALEKIKSNSYKLTQQRDINPVGTYFGMRKAGDERVDFSWDAVRFHNFVRGVSPPAPGARFVFEGNEYIIDKTMLVDEAPRYMATCGEVVGRDAGGVVVKVGDSVIRLTAIRCFDKNTDESRVPTFRIGSRLSGL